MLQISHCRQCGKSEINGVAAQVNFTKHSHCDSCHHGHDRKFDLFFCSPKCMVEYMREEGDKVIAVAQEFQDNTNWPYLYRDGKLVDVLHNGHGCTGLPAKRPQPIRQGVKIETIENREE